MAEKEIQTHKDGVLTLDGMKAVIASGNSVQMPNGRVITKVEDLPKASELAKDDPKAARDAMAELQRLQREQAAEIDRLKNIAAGKNPDGTEKKPEAPPDDSATA